MELRVTDAAAQQLVAQLSAKDGSHIRLAVERPHHEGLHGGIIQPKIVPEVVTDPDYAVANCQAGEVDFYIDYADEWYYSGKVIVVDLVNGQIDYQLNGQHPAPSAARTADPTAPAKPDASTSVSQHFEELWD